MTLPKKLRGKRMSAAQWIEWQRLRTEQARHAAFAAAVKASPNSYVVMQKETER